MTRRAALAIARDLRAAEYKLSKGVASAGPSDAARREAEVLISGALARLIAASQVDGLS